MARAAVNRTVLLVDDDLTLLKTLEAVVLGARDDCRVLLGPSGREALAIMASESVDLLVTDVQMPDVDGIAMLQELVAAQLYVSTVAVTAFLGDEIDRQLLAAGAFDVFRKPIDFDRFLMVLGERLDQPEAGVIQGVTLSGFLQLLHLERRTCSVRVVSKGRSGRLAIRAGELIDAVSSGGLRPLDAAMSILAWSEPSILVEPHGSWATERIALPMNNIVFDAARVADEKRRGGRSSSSTLPRVATPRTWLRRVSDMTGTVASVQPASGDSQSTAWRINMADIKGSLQKAMQIEGALGVALVDYDTGMVLGTTGNPGFDMELAAAGNTDVVRAKKKIRDMLGLKDRIEDILISLTGQYHLVRMVGTNVFFYVVLDRTKTNLGLARKQLEAIEKAIDIERS